MKVDPVSRYTEPRFPTHAILNAHPELLRMVPARWRNNQAVLTVLASLCLVTGCKIAQKETPTAVAQTPIPSRVAPIFPHGAGHGSFGCVAVNPPVFLSEAEARQVIIEEGKRAGISFTTDSMTLPNINVPITSESYPPMEEKTERPRTQQQPLKLDGTDFKRHISYEYVSQDDFHAWENPKGSRSTVSDFDILGTAKELRDSIAQTAPTGALAVFYDPMIGYNVGDTPLKSVNRFSNNTMAPLQVFSYWGYISKEFNNDILIRHENFSVKIVIGSDTARLNNKIIKLPCKVLKINGAVYVPLRAVADLLQIKIRWEQKQSIVYLSKPGMNYETSSTIVTKQDDQTHKNIDIAFSEYDNIGRTATANDVARTELRQQVRDFITWLKGEGVI